MYECDICKDVGVIYIIEDGKTKSKPCRCIEVKKAKARMLQSGLHEHDLKTGFKDFNLFDSEALKKVKEHSIDYYVNFEKYSNTRNNSILLSGATGRGKTMLGLCISNNLMKNDNIPVIYMPYVETLTKIKQEIYDGEAYQEDMGRLKKADVLFIDDLFKSNVTRADIDRVYELINFRYLARKPVIFSTEKTPKQMIELDEALGGRIIEMCQDHIVRFDESIPNYRLRGIL